MSTFRTNGGQFIKNTMKGIDNSQASNSNIRNISAEIYVAVDGENPNRNVYIENLITATGVIQTLPEAVDYFSVGKTLFSQGALMAASELTKSKIEGAFTPDTEKTIRAGISLEKKLAGTHIGYHLFVRAKYEEYESGIFGGWKEKHSKLWSLWQSGGDNDDGNFFYKEQMTKKIVRKAMEWRVRLFVREGI